MSWVSRIIMLSGCVGFMSELIDGDGCVSWVSRIIMLSGCVGFMSKSIDTDDRVA